MILLPVPELSNVKKFHVSLILALFLVAMHFFVEANRTQSLKHEFSDDQSIAYYNVQIQLYERHLQNMNRLKNKEQRLLASILEKKSDDLIYLTAMTRGTILDASFDPLKISRIGLDQIEYSDWLEVHLYMTKNIMISPAYHLGLNQDDYGWDRWISYMFVHMGWYHLLSNVIFLLLFGALVETLFGGVIVTLVFLGSGFFAAPIYMMLTELNMVSMVGASGGVCGLISFYAISNFQNPIRYWYWVLPFEKYYGFVSMSSGYVLILWAVGDLAGYFSGVTFLDNVAYAAHIGGFIIGSICALGLHAYKSYIRPQKNRLITT